MSHALVCLMFYVASMVAIHLQAPALSRLGAAMPMNVPLFPLRSCKPQHPASPNCRCCPHFKHLPASYRATFDDVHQCHTNRTPRGHKCTKSRGFQGLSMRNTHTHTQGFRARLGVHQRAAPRARDRPLQTIAVSSILHGTMQFNS